MPDQRRGRAGVRGEMASQPAPEETWTGPHELGGESPACARTKADGIPRSVQGAARRCGRDHPHSTSAWRERQGSSFGGWTGRFHWLACTCLLKQPLKTTRTPRRLASGGALDTYPGQAGKAGQGGAGTPFSVILVLFQGSLMLFGAASIVLLVARSEGLRSPTSTALPPRGSFSVSPGWV